MTINVFLIKANSEIKGSCLLSHRISPDICFVSYKVPVSIVIAFCRI